MLRWLKGVPLVRNFAEHLDDLHDASYVLLDAKPLAVAMALGFVGWGLEAFGFYLVIYGFTDLSSFEVFVQCAFIMGVANLAGAISFLPGGLGVSETGITALSRALLDVSRATAAAATILIRFLTLWFGVLIGLLALASVSRKLGRAIPEETLEPATAP